MNTKRIQTLQKTLTQPILIKKKENLYYLLGKSFEYGYLLVRTGKKSPIFLGDGLEKIEQIQSDVLKNVGTYIGPKEKLEVFGEFTYAEVQYIKKKNPKLHVVVTVDYDPVDKMRAIKEPGEILLVKKSMQIVEKVFALIKKEMQKPGMTEEKLAQFIRRSGLSMGAEDVSFPPIVCCGSHAATPHHVPGNTKLTQGKSIIIDFGFKYKGYCSDFTRTLFLGFAPKNLIEAYHQVEKSYLESIRFISDQKKVTGGQVYKKSVSVLAEKKLEKYFIHSLGHGTGLEIHELPNLSPASAQEIKNGTVFSIEPGVYIEGVGGIRIEDLVYREHDVCRKFISVSTKLEDCIIKQ